MGTNCCDVCVLVDLCHDPDMTSNEEFGSDPVRVYAIRLENGGDPHGP
jgi:hypothetical protein